MTETVRVGPQSIGGSILSKAAQDNAQTQYNRQITDIEQRIGRSNKENVQLCFQNKQLSAQVRRLTIDIKSLERRLAANKHPTTRCFRCRPEPESQSTKAAVRSKAPTPAMAEECQKCASANSATEHRQSDAQTQDAARFVAGNLDQLEKELLLLRAERDHLRLENDELSSQVGGLETNLLRSEALLNTSRSLTRSNHRKRKTETAGVRCRDESPKTDRKHQSRNGKQKHRQSCEDRGRTRSQSAGGAGNRSRSNHSYCATCNQYRQSLMQTANQHTALLTNQHSPNNTTTTINNTTTNHSVSLSSDNRLTDLTRRNEKLSGDRDSMKRLYLESEKEASCLRQRLLDAQLQLAALNSAQSNTNKVDGHVPITQQLHNLQRQHSLDKQRTARNQSLMQARITQLNQQNCELRAQGLADATQLEKCNTQIDSLNAQILSLQRCQQQPSVSVLDGIKQTERVHNDSHTRTSSTQSSTRSNNHDLAHLQEIIRTKDREILHLKDIVRELSADYNKLRSNVTEQENNLQNIQLHLSEKHTLTGTDTDTGTGHNALILQITQLKEQLEEALRVQEQLRCSTRQHLDRMHQLQTLLDQKEAEREQLSAELGVLQSSVERELVTADADPDPDTRLLAQQLNLDSQQLQALQRTSERWRREREALVQQLGRCESVLASLRERVHSDDAQRQSLHKDLVAARHMILDKDQHNQTLMRQLAHLETLVHKHNT